MFRLSCPRCGAKPKKAKLSVVSGTFEAVDMLLERGGFDFTERTEMSTSDEMVQCSACGTIFPLSECSSENPKPLFKPFRGFDWTELAERFGVDIPASKELTSQMESDPLVKYIDSHCAWCDQDTPELVCERARVCGAIREFLAALIKNNPSHYVQLLKGLAKIKHDQTFTSLFEQLLPYMWY